MKSFALVCALLASSTYGHIQMSKPFPIRSPLNKDSSGDKDYSYTNPLSTDGSDYPCKGYAGDPFHSVATYSPGQEYDLELEGSATHGGGSCQIALSYDKGESFQVIHSILGGCPIQKSYKFSIPSDAQSGEALLAWTWFNKVGNREMYMNCAQVTIGGSRQRKPSFKAISRREAFSSLPPLFEANVNGPGQCKTVEGQEVNFPVPGPSVEGSLSGEGYKCSGSAPFLEGGSKKAANSPVGSSILSFPSSAVHFPMTSMAVGASPIPTPSPSSSSAVASPSSKLASSFGAQHSSSSVRTMPTARPDNLSDMESANTPCIPGTIICAHDGRTWWLCSEGRPVHMGSVAAGTHCLHGGMQRVD